jgi:hypothetical protein
MTTNTITPAIDLFRLVVENIALQQRISHHEAPGLRKHQKVLPSGGAFFLYTLAKFRCGRYNLLSCFAKEETYGS